MSSEVIWGVHWLIVMGIIGLLILDGFRYSKRAQLWAEAQAEVLKSRHGGGDDVVIDVAYEFSGELRQTSLRTGGDLYYFPPGRKLILLVNPEKPDQCVVKR
jgi:hypothetical protein